jgi:membrane-associated phospholipid phosphatase
MLTRPPAQMLAAAAACVAAFAGLLALAYAVPPAEKIDGAALDGFAAVGEDWRISSTAEHIAHLFNPLPFALMVIVLVAVAYVTRGYRHAAAAALLLVGANVSSQLLKPMLAHPRDLSEFHHVTQLGPAAFPSGHSTASMSLALAAMLVAPRAYRPLVALIGLLGTLVVSGSLLVLSWHWPSDIVGGYLLAAAWCLVALAALRAAAIRWPDKGDMRKAARQAVAAPSPAAVASAAFVILAVAAVAAAARLDSLAGYAQRHTSTVAVAAAIVASAMAVVAAVTAMAARRH